MHFDFDKPTCLNIRKSLRLEWLETNGLGGYASSSIVCCNTRKYHALFAANLEKPAGRYVLLSAIEESVIAGETEFALSIRQHPGNFYPKGHEYLREAHIDAYPSFVYRFGDIVITKEILMPRGQDCVLIKYSMQCATDPSMKALLKLRPMLAFRSFHAIAKANLDLHTKTFPAPGGFKVQPYDGMPPLHMQCDAMFKFYPSPDWCYNVEYMLERERGFPYTEDLFMPGFMEIEITPQRPVIFSASIEPMSVANFASMWDAETARRRAANKSANTIIGHLAREGEKFLINDSANGKSVIAGYPWFDAWGRDTMIALPGLTFWAGRHQDGIDVLSRAGGAMKDGLIPNTYAADGNHGYNSVDASLWYVWAVQQMLATVPNAAADIVRNNCWEPIKEIIYAYANNRTGITYMDNAGLIHVGTPDTQLTWMDAQANGKPVTPRWGCPVEINALWYNALVFANKLALRFGEKLPCEMKKIAKLKTEFTNRFWSEDRGYLADVWRPEGADWSFRPNQLFAASLPEPVVDRPIATAVLGKVRQYLLTPYGLRTLAPFDRDYRSLYEGNPTDRDSAYHQGTVWTWLLGAYCDAQVYVTWDRDAAARHFLNTVAPLFTKHLRDYGVGSIAEIFDAAPPFRPNGTIAQAWSVAELLRALKKIEKMSPGTYRRWEDKVLKEVF